MGKKQIQQGNTVPFADVIKSIRERKNNHSCLDDLPSVNIHCCHLTINTICKNIEAVRVRLWKVKKGVCQLYIKTWALDETSFR